MTHGRRKPDDRVRLLHGPYKAPRLHVGDRATCLYRDCDVVVTAWTDAPISWPRGLPVGTKGHPSHLVDEELARAVRTESAAAVGYWWGVTAGVVWRWRRALGVGRMDSEGSRRLILAASVKGAAATRGVELPPEQVERRCRTALELNLGRNLRPGYNLGPRSTDADAVLLGKLPDGEVARRTGRSLSAVSQKRRLLGLPNPVSGRRRWTPEADALLRTLPREEAARRTGRSIRLSALMELPTVFIFTHDANDPLKHAAS
jgi:hypothetical protein